MTATTFPPAVGGDGSTVSDDNDALTGLGNGGHRTRFVPALAQVVAVAQYIVNVANGTSNGVFSPVRGMTTVNDTLSGVAARDGLTPVVGDRWLVKNQTTGSQNGIYIVAAGAWTRAADAAVSANFVPNKIVAVSEGTTGANSYWFISNTGTITLGTTAITFLDLPSKTKTNIWTVAQTFSGGASFGAAVTISSTLGMSGGAINEAQGANIASAATINLDAATGNLVDVTGTIGITAITLTAGRERTTRFTGALTLTNSASLILPGLANYTTTSGDVLIWRGFPSGVVQCVGFLPGSSRPILASGGTMTGPLAMSGAAVNTAQGADIASAATINLDAATGNLINISGTAAISTVTLSNGRERTARATGAFTLTHGASLVVAPGLVSRTVNVGDSIRFFAISGVTYAVIDSEVGGLVPIASGNINTGGDTAITVPTNAFSRLILRVTGLKAAATYVPYFQLSGLTTAIYQYVYVGASSGGVFAAGANGATGCPLSRQDVANDSSSTTSNPFSFDMIINDPNSADFKEVSVEPVGFVRDSGASNGHAVAQRLRLLSTAVVSSINILLRNTAGTSPGGSVVNANAGTYTLYADLG